MEFSFNLPLIFTLLGAVQTFLLACALLGLKRGFETANRILVFLLLIISFTLIGNVMTNVKYFLVFPHSAQIFVPLQFLFAPLFFLYIKTLIFRKSVWGKSSVLHFLPFVLCILYLMPFYLQSGDYKINYLNDALQNYPLNWRIRSGLMLIQQIIYLSLLVNMLAGYDSIRNKNKLTHKINLYWAWGLTITFLLVLVIGVVRLFFTFSAETSLIIPIIISLWSYAVAYLGLRNPEVIIGISEEVGKSEEVSRKKYEKSALPPTRAEKYLQKLLHVMENEKPYLESDITIQKLAGLLSVSPQHLSQIINEKTNQNFAEFINTYRIEETKRRLTSPADKHLSIIAIAEMSGFNSKSAFNTAFKKRVGTTPSEFRKTISSSDS